MEAAAAAVTEEQEITVDVRKIMEDINEQIKGMSLRQKKLSFKDEGSYMLNPAAVGEYDAEIFSDILDYLRGHCRVESFRKLDGALIPVKKVIRRLTQFYVEPVCNDQAEFNEFVVRSMDQVEAFIHENEELRDIVDSQERQIRELEEKLSQKKEDGTS